MHDVLRQRLWRHIEALPEAQLYQALDYIEFLTSKYARDAVRAPGTGFQRFGERLEDKMRGRGVGFSAIRGAMEALGSADRFFSGVAEAGRSVLREVEEGLKAEPRPAEPRTPPLPTVPRQLAPVAPANLSSPEDSGPVPTPPVNPQP